MRNHVKTIRSGSVQNNSNKGLTLANNLEENILNILELSRKTSQDELRQRAYLLENKEQNFTKRNFLKYTYETI